MHRDAQRCTEMHRDAQRCTKMHRNAPSFHISAVVMYQHRKLHREKHGYDNVMKREKERHERDYKLWEEGEWIPTER